MAVFSVDSDAVLTATSGIRATADRIETDSAAMLAQLTGLQSTWTGAASAGFQSAVEQWRAAHRQVQDSLASISVALGSAGRNYAEAEQAASTMFR